MYRMYRNLIYDANVLGLWIEIKMFIKFFDIYNIYIIF